MTNYDPGDHTAVEVRAYVADHPDEAAAILEAEQAGKNRSTLVADLSADEPEPEAQTVEEEVPDKPEDADISPPGEYPDEGIFGYISEEAEPK